VLAHETGQVLAMGLQDAHGRDLVLRHETAVTHRVGAQDGR